MSSTAPTTRAARAERRLARALTPDAAARAELLAAGVNLTRVNTLYPLDPAQLLEHARVGLASDSRPLDLIVAFDASWQAGTNLLDEFVDKLTPAAAERYWEAHDNVLWASAFDRLQRAASKQLLTLDPDIGAVGWYAERYALGVFAAYWLLDQGSAATGVSQATIDKVVRWAAEQLLPSPGGRRG